MTIPAEYLARHGYDARFAGRPFTDTEYVAAVNERRGATPTTPTTNARQCAVDTACVHRGATVGERQCPSCGGVVMIRVFGCAVHGTCSVIRDVGVRVCVACPDRKAVA